MDFIICFMACGCVYDGAAGASFIPAAGTTRLCIALAAQKTVAHKKHRQHVWLRGCSNNTRHGSWSWSRVLLWVATAAHRLCVPRPSPHHLCHHLLWTLLHHVLHLHVQRHTTRVMCVCYYHMPPHASQQQLQDEVMRSAVAPQLHCKCIRCCNSCRCQRNKHSPNVPRWQ